MTMLLGGLFGLPARLEEGPAGCRSGRSAGGLAPDSRPGSRRSRAAAPTVRSKTSASVSRLPGWQGELPAVAQPALVAGPPGSGPVSSLLVNPPVLSVLGVWYSPGAFNLAGPRWRPIGRPQCEADIQLLVGPLAQRPQDGLVQALL